ncbi:MAG TPA: DUF4157 domain-containing protein [Thermoanaerobaculia bacterium]|nr:DUF4157 domain-containing protein [Thermoanaerobaculia bacterium]
MLHRISSPASRFLPTGAGPQPEPPTRPSAADAFERAAQILPFAARSAAEIGASQEVQQRFAARFAEAAADKHAFHQLMRQVYGPGYDVGSAEALRQRTLRGDTGWLPRIEWKSETSLQGGYGAYDAGRDVVYLNERFLADPAAAARVYAEEVGHFLDKRLKATDTPGDEGEMFRRLLSGERLGAAQRAAIRAEDDKGFIEVDGRRVEVELWNPAKAIKKAVEAVGKGVSKAARAVGKAVKGAARAVGEAAGAAWDGVKSAGRTIWNGVRSAGETVWGGLESVGETVWKGVEWVGGKIADGARWLGPRLWDAGRNLVDGVWQTVRGAAMNVWEGIETFGRGIGKIFRGDVLDGLADLGKGLLETFLQTPADAVLMLGGRVVSAVQTVFGLEAPGRKLSGDEIAMLRDVYGDSIDYDSVRIKEGKTGVFGASGRPFTHGNTIYVPQSWLNDHPDPAERRQLLVHEMAHVWQNQHGGTDYMTEALGAQWFGDGYNFAKGLVAGERWGDLNPEQQAELLEKAFESGYLTSSDPNKRFLVKLTDPDSDHGFEVRMVTAGSADHEALLAAGYGDFTAVLEDALRQVREGQGAG